MHTKLVSSKLVPSTALALALSAALVAPSCVDAATLTTEKLTSMLTDLGYEPSVAADTVTLENQGTTKAYLKFTLTNDNSMLNVYSNWSVPKDKADAIPSVEMLKANSNAPFAFAIFFNEDKSEYVDLEASFDVSLVSKKMLRKTIDTMLEQIESKKALWDADQWSAPATGAASPAPGAKSAADARADLDALWAKSPMAADHAVFATEKVASYGSFVEQRPEFHAGDTYHIYFEPKNYVWKQLEGGLYNIGLKVAVKIKDEQGHVDEMLAEQDLLSLNSHDKVTEVMTNLGLSGIDKIPVGSYTFICTVSDKNSDKKVDVSLPFKVVAK